MITSSYSVKILVFSALHILNPVFRSISFSPNVQQLMKALDYSDPAIVQSMYIFKV